MRCKPMQSQMQMQREAASREASWKARARWTNMTALRPARRRHLPLGPQLGFPEDGIIALEVREACRCARSVVELGARRRLAR